jgi:predicted MFS family arabinose efflux permease
VAAGVVALVLLVHQERRAPSPLIPLSLLGLPVIWRSDALAACLGAALVSLITLLPIYLEVVRGLSPGTTGLLLVPLTIGIGTGSLVTGRLVSRTGRTTIFPVFGLASATVNLLVLALGARVLSPTALGWLLLLHGLFMGTVMGVVQVTVQSASGPRRLGEAAASVQFSRATGVAPDLSAAPRAIQADIADAFRAAFLSIAVFTTAGFWLALSIPLRRI